MNTDPDYVLDISRPPSTSSLTTCDLTSQPQFFPLSVRTHTDTDAKPSTIRRRLSALSSCYRCLATHDVITHHPVAGVVQP